MPGQDPYMQVGSPSDVSQVNPFADQTFNMLAGTLGSAGGQAGQLAQHAVSGLSPGALLNQFAAGSSGLQNIALNATNPLVSSQMSLANQIGRNAIHDQAALAAAGGVGLSSSSFADAASRAASLPQQQAIANIVQAQTGLAGQLLGGGLNLFGQAPQTALGAANLFGGLAGQSLGGLTALGGPEFYQPTYVENPNYLSASDLLGAGVMGLGLL